MIFCKWQFSSLEALKTFFIRYGICSRQIINANKSYIYVGGIKKNIMDQIVAMLGFNIGSLLFTYLGAPIFKGRPKMIHCQPIADKFKLNYQLGKPPMSQLQEESN